MLEDKTYTRARLLAMLNNGNKVVSHPEVGYQCISEKILTYTAMITLALYVSYIQCNQVPFYFALKGTNGNTFSDTFW